MKAWYGIAAVLMLLAGCGGSEEDAETQERVGGVAQPRPVEQAPAQPAVEPFIESVTIGLTASLRNDRRLLVSGTTNLPDATRLQVLVEREVSGVRWQARTEVAQGRFAAGPFGPGSGLPDGGYRITVNMTAVSVQPSAVRARLGNDGQHLSGPLVRSSPHGLGQVVRASQRFLVGSEPRHTTDQVEVRELD